MARGAWFWNPERDEKLKTLWASHTTREIEDAFGRAITATAISRRGKQLKLLPSKTRGRPAAPRQEKGAESARRKTWRPGEYAKPVNAHKYPPLGENVVIVEDVSERFRNWGPPVAAVKRAQVLPASTFVRTVKPKVEPPPSGCCAYHVERDGRRAFCFAETGWTVNDIGGAKRKQYCADHEPRVRGISGREVAGVHYGSRPTINPARFG